MASTGKKWLLGCAAGCGVLVVVGAIGAVWFGLFVKNTFEGMGEAAEVRDRLETEHGLAGDFVPEADGSIPADRIEVFLAVREATQIYRQRISETWEALPTTPDQHRRLEEGTFLDKLGAAFSMGREAFGLARELGDFFETRNRALLARGMGLGEYTYIYAMAYWSWLGHSPEEGPEHARVTESGEVRIGSGAEVHSDVSENVYEDRIHAQLLSMLENQIDTLSDDDPWRADLQSEIETMEGDRRRVPWESTVPPAIVASLEPYRERLETTWSPSVNPFELMRLRKQGWSIRAD